MSVNRTPHLQADPSQRLCLDLRSRKSVHTCGGSLQQCRGLAPCGLQRLNHRGQHEISSIKNLVCNAESRLGHLFWHLCRVSEHSLNEGRGVGRGRGRGVNSAEFLSRSTASLAEIEPSHLGVSEGCMSMCASERAPTVATELWPPRALGWALKKPGLGLYAYSGPQGHPAGFPVGVVACSNHRRSAHVHGSGNR